MYDFEATAHTIIHAKDQTVAVRADMLARLCPEVVQQISRDRGPGGPLIFWGKCRNVDEVAEQVIVAPAILEAIFDVAGQTLECQYPHAGLQHTYGYLFSIIDTPYGKKRDRWTGTSLESGLGLPLTVLGPSPEEGTLLSNVTWLAGTIAFQGHKRFSWLKRCLTRRIASALPALDLRKRQRLRFTESVELPSSDDRPCQIKLVTDVVRLHEPAAETPDNSWLLVYSVDDPRQQHPQLITLFTVTDEFVEALRQRGLTPGHHDIRPRYNAFVPGFPAESQFGVAALYEF